MHKLCDRDKCDERAVGKINNDNGNDKYLCHVHYRKALGLEEKSDEA